MLLTICIIYIQHIIINYRKIMKSQIRNSQPSRVSVLQRKKYSFFCKIFCCKCVYCCQSFDFSLLTSENRKGAFFEMIQLYVKSIESEPNVIIDPFFILLGLLLGQSDEQINAATISEIQDSNEKQSIFSKQDLELYIPQLCTYLVFHEDLSNIPIFNLLERTARFDIQFALIYYSYMKSLQTINENKQFKIVMKYNSTFRKKIDSHFKFVNESKKETIDSEDLIESYNSRRVTKKQLSFGKLQSKPQRKLYRSCFSCKENDPQQINVFGSCLSFLSDLVQIGKNLIKIPNKRLALQELQKSLEKMNHQLPADIYLPLKSSDYKGMKVANIVYEQCKVFYTKMRAPFYICLQMYEDKHEAKNPKFKRLVSIVNMNDSQLRKSHLFEQDTIEEQMMPKKQQTSTGSKNKWVEKIYSVAKKAEKYYKNNRIKSFISEATSEIHLETQEQETLQMFGQSQIDQEQRIKMISPFSNLPKHKLIHLIVKTEDDLRQQAFAMQLLEEFNQIFTMQGLPIRVVPYEVIPLGLNCGIIEFLKDTLTIDQLRKKQGTFEFIRTDPIKLKNFLNTLVGYSLVTYLIQVKDRHNGNIMIRRDGSIIHIDFGFFMSNAPGKGVQLEKKVAFKLTNEYIQTLGGLKSKKFEQFRKLFFQGYQACRKHQHRILILTKLMYSSHGSTMPCFEKGNIAIEELQDRLNPPRLRTDGDLSLFCQNLINNSIDNWRAKWYDKWQYYMQGILE